MLLYDTHTVLLLKYALFTLAYFPWGFKYRMSILFIHLFKMFTCSVIWLFISTSQRHPLLSSIVNQRSPLMVSLLPSPKEQSPHLFLGSRARNQIPLKAEYCDTKAHMEQLDQQLASVR